MEFCDSCEKETLPLVSLVVLCYNSSGTIVETLESIKNQTYPNIELIVSDDYSTDDTLLVVKNWLNANEDRFVYTNLVTTKKNTGVAGNINRGVHDSHGQWIKSLAGDDILVPNAIEEFIRFIDEHSESIKMCVCDVEPFTTSGEKPSAVIELYKSFFEKECEPYEKQLRRVMTELVFIGPVYFYSRELFDQVGGFSEEYGCAEEWPFVYKVLRNGNPIYALNKKLIRYRVQEKSLSHVKENNRLLNRRVFDGKYRHYFDHAYVDLLHEGHYLKAWHYALLYRARRMQYHINSLVLQKTILYGFMAFSPLAWLRRLHIVKAEP